MKKKYNFYEVRAFVRISPRGKEKVKYTFLIVNLMICSNNKLGVVNKMFANRFDYNIYEQISDNIELKRKFIEEELKEPIGHFTYEFEKIIYIKKIH